MIVTIPASQPQAGGGEAALTMGFKRKDTYIKGKRMTSDMAMAEYLTLGETVRFSASLQDQGRLSGHCFHVWKGKPPTFIEKIIGSTADSR